MQPARLRRDGARRRGPDRGGAGRRPGAALDRRPAGRARPAVAGAAAGRPGAGRRATAPARLVGAQAQLALGRGAAARATLAGLNGPGVGDAARRGLRPRRRARPRAGAARRPRATPAPTATPGRPAPGRGSRRGRRAARRARDGGLHGAAARRRRRAADPAALPPELAFREPVPDLSRPSLEAARRLLAVGPKVGGTGGRGARRGAVTAERPRPRTPCALAQDAYEPRQRRDAGAVERGGLENRCGGDPTQGSKSLSLRQRLPQTRSPFVRSAEFSRCFRGL